ncbi:hypothetical protein D6201_03285 [Aurantiacibacter aquimixticola]|uniref:Uncharacterized protein n=2 Tax=Aurantiacibacter aquimixticola TaxID=1958945 RepID=A0A419RRU9_9SPHN|nr:hypothetical protein D6201_03285 [Aurantiacibacter aquimixticola]
MTQNPDAAVRAHRERLYSLTLASGVANIVALVMHLNGASSILLGPIFGATCGSLIVAGIKGNTDSYYNALVSVGLRWMAFSLGVLLLLLWMQAEASIIDRLIPGFEILAKDSFILALTLGLFFHGGYAFAFLFDTLRSGKD